MKKIRKLHLWIGLVSSFLILIESVTGLFMIEPWLIGANNPAVNNNLMGFIRRLHVGRIGDTDLSIFLDIIAVGLIILTSTGIYLSIKILRLQNIRRSNDLKPFG